LTESLVLGDGNGFLRVLGGGGGVVHERVEQGGEGERGGAIDGARRLP
jgi:hypothetical protein